MFREREKDLLNPPVLIVDNNRRECHRSRGAGGKTPPQLCYDMKERGVGEGEGSDNRRGI